LDQKWADWFGGLSITLEANGDTLLTGKVVDQAALYGLLKKVRDLGMPLLSLACIKTGHTDVPDSKGIRITGCSSAQRGRKTDAQGQ